MFILILFVSLFCGLLIGFIFYCIKVYVVNKKEKQRQIFRKNVFVHYKNRDSKVQFDKALLNNDLKESQNCIQDGCMETKNRFSLLKNSELEYLNNATNEKPVISKYGHYGFESQILIDLFSFFYENFSPDDIPLYLIISALNKKSQYKKSIINPHNKTIKKDFMSISRRRLKELLKEDKYVYLFYVREGQIVYDEFFLDYKKLSKIIKEHKKQSKKRFNVQTRFICFNINRSRLDEILRNENLKIKKLPMDNN